MSKFDEYAVFPKMYKIKQNLSDKKIIDIPTEVFKELDSLGLKKIIKPGTDIAVCGGSRGINNIGLIVKSVCDYVKSCAATPFIVPAMGSHGNADAQGQKTVLEKFGMSEEAMGCEIRSSMETVKFQDTAIGTPVYFDKIAFESDGIIVVNRIKPHTDFTAENESGIVKMLSVGLGKQKGASAMHDNGLGRTIPETTKVIIEKAPVLAGVGIVENAKDETYIIKGVRPADFIEEDARLLKISYEQVPKLPYGDVDILIVEEMGKQFSGTGMDTKVLGRIKIPGEIEPEFPNVKKLVTLRLSEDSYGNALGIGLADITVKKLVDAIDYEAMYSNLITTTFLERGKVPVFMPTEKEAIGVAFRTSGGMATETAKIMIIKNTLDLGEVIVSQSIYEEIKAEVSLIEENVEIKFDEEGKLSF